MPSLIFTKDAEGIEYFPTEIWQIKKLKKLLRRGTER